MSLLAIRDEKGCAELWFAVMGAGPTSLAALAMTPDMSAQGLHHLMLLSWQSVWLPIRYYYHVQSHMVSLFLLSSRLRMPKCLEN